MAEVCIAQRQTLQKGTANPLQVRVRCNQLCLSPVAMQMQDQMLVGLQTLTTDEQTELRSGESFECRGAADTRVQLVAICQDIVDRGNIDIDPRHLIDVALKARPDNGR